MKIVVVGANGYLGKVVVQYYASRGAQVVAFTRKAIFDQPNVINVVWDGKTVRPENISFIDRAAFVVNLAGKSVNCRYTKKNRKAILDSRIETTNAIGGAIKLCSYPPELWINAASATIYRHSEDKAMDETYGEIGQGFSVDVCQQWEHAFFANDTPSTRKVALRTAIAIGQYSEVSKMLKRLVTCGLGGDQGTGRQMFSWIHDEDFCRILDFLLETKTLEGPVNASSPNPLTNQQMMKALRKRMGYTFGLPLPAWILEIGAILIGTESELILKSRWVVPDKLLKSGFLFNYPSWNQALEQSGNY